MGIIEEYKKILKQSFEIGGKAGTKTGIALKRNIEKIQTIFNLFLDIFSILTLIVLLFNSLNWFTAIVGLHLGILFYSIIENRLDIIRNNT